eukprot:UN29831
MSEPLSIEVSYYQHGRALKKIDMLSGCSEKFLKLIANRMQLVIYGPGDTIIEQGDKGSNMYIIFKGEVGIYVKKKGETNEVMVNTQGEGTFFGEVALLYPTLLRTATIRAHTFCDVFEISTEQLGAIATLYPVDSELMMINANKLIHSKYPKERLATMFNIDVQESEDPTERSKSEQNTLQPALSLAPGVTSVGSKTVNDLLTLLSNIELQNKRLISRFDDLSDRLEVVEGKKGKPEKSRFLL